MIKISSPRKHTPKYKIITIKPENGETITTSIVILSLLRQAYTSKCLQSIFQHSQDPYEIIVVDMGSPKKITSWLKKLAARHENISVIFNKTNVGSAKGRNQGINIAKGKYVVFLDNDTKVTKGWLYPLINSVEKSQEIGACGAKIITFRKIIQYCPAYIKKHFKDNLLKTIGLDRRIILKDNSFLVNRSQEVFWYPTTCFLVKKDALNKIGGFDGNLNRAEEDKDICLSLRKIGFKIVYTPHSKVYHLHRDSGLAYRKIRYDMKLISKDINYFERKWQCKSLNIISREYLKKIGYGERQIRIISKFNLFITVAN